MSQLSQMIYSIVTWPVHSFYCLKILIYSFEIQCVRAWAEGRIRGAEQ